MGQHAEKLVLAPVGLADLFHQDDVFQHHAGALSQIVGERAYGRVRGA